MKNNNFFKLYWDKKIGKAKRVTHWSELDYNTFISIRDQLRAECKKYPDSPETAAHNIAQEYGLDFNETFHMAYNFLSRIDIFD